MQRNVIAIASLAALAAALPLFAVTNVTAVRYSSDITVSLGGVLVTPQKVAEEKTVVSLINVGTIPPGTNIRGYAVDASGAQLFTLDTTVILGSTTFEPRDVVRYNGSTYNKAFTGGARLVPVGVGINELAASGTDFLFVFDTSVQLGVITATPRDVVRFSGGTYSIAFDGKLNGIPDGVMIDGLHLLRNGHYLFSFDISGTVGGVSFDDEDVIEWTPAGGTWQMAYDGSVKQTNWPAADLVALYAADGVPGDVNGDGTVSPGDIFDLINFLFAGGTAPTGLADADGDGTISPSDIFYLINFLFAAGPPPIG